MFLVRTVWVAELEGSVKHMVHLILNEKRGHLYVATHGYVLNLDALTGYTSIYSSLLTILIVLSLPFSILIIFYSLEG